MNKNLKAFVVNEIGFPEHVLNIAREEVVNLIKKYKNFSKIMVMDENDVFLVLVSYGKLEDCEDLEWKQELVEELNN